MPATVIALHDLVLCRGAWSCAVPELEVVPGRAVALVGPSGCGKTSVLLEALGLGETRRTGSVVRGAALDNHRAWLRHEVAVVLQDAMGALDPFESIGSQLAAATGADGDALVAALAQLGIEPERGRALIRRRPYEISGGEAQRCLMAVAVLRRPGLVVVDEPGANLDGDNVERVLACLRSLRADGAGLLVATHDERVVRGLDAEVFAWDGRAFVPRVSTDQGGWKELRREAPVGGEALRLRGVGVELGGRAVLESLDLTLQRGEITAVVGPSGAGKSTLARVAAGLCLPDRGDVVGPERRAAVQLVFQDARGSLTPGRQVAAMIEEVATVGFDPAGMAERLGLSPELLQRRADELSGGESRRVALLRALAVEPVVMICDEPLASLDVPTMRAVTRALLEVRATSNAAMLVFSHDRGWCEAIADHVLELRDGRLLPWTPS